MFGGWGSRVGIGGGGKAPVAPEGRPGTEGPSAVREGGGWGAGGERATEGLGFGNASMGLEPKEK